MPARPHPGPLSADVNRRQSAATSAWAVTAVLVATFPGAVVGAVLAHAVWTIARVPLSRRVIGAAVAGVTLLSVSPVIGWPLRTLAQSLGRGAAPSAGSLLRNLAIDVLVGPVLALAYEAARYLQRRTLLGQIEQAHSVTTKRAKALQPNWSKAPGAPQDGLGWDHPAGKIRLGAEVSGTPFDLSVDEIAQHVFIPGISGFGKTTTLMRLASGALANRFAVAIVDAKGIGLGSDARRLAAHHGVTYRYVDPGSKGTTGYDLCSGEPADIANKIIGAFTFGGEAEIYKQIAMEVVPLIARAIVASGEKVTLDALYEALGKGGMSRLARAHGAEKYRDRLLDLDEAGGIGPAGYLGLQRRLGALREGKFGDVFTKTPALDWGKATKAPSVTYLALSKTAASEDVELFARVILQDLKQLCDTRLRQIDRGKPPIPMLVVFDEFAALREATQIEDLLLQARQARMSIVVASQYLPQEPTIREPVVQSGVLLIHRVGARDSDELANELGTHKTPFATVQLDYAQGTSEKGSVRVVDEFNIHPNLLRELPVGAVVVYARRANIRAIVHIHRDEL